MAITSAAEALSYEEPAIVTILVQSSFLLLLNAANTLLDATLYCGLVGEVFIGVFWGTPLGGWLGQGVEKAVEQLGYLGLILLVYEGGLNTSLGPLLHNLALSVAVALTGIGCPIGLSFVLGPMLSATPLQCFAAGAALSATSLGTTFTILSSAGFANTRLGTVLTSAAMIDDVIGLVLIQVISSLGGNSVSISGEAIGRPIGASIGLLVVTLAVCWFAKKSVPGRRFATCIARPESKFVLQTSALIAFVVVASYAGASPLFAAFLAGASVSWWDGLPVKRAAGASCDPASTAGNAVAPAGQQKPSFTSIEIYEKYYGQPVERILKPFFFASIGFSIPITQMFKASTVWRGIVYSMLMLVGKLLTGFWLVRVAVPQVLGPKKPARKLLQIPSKQKERQKNQATPQLDRREKPANAHDSTPTTSNVANSAKTRPKPAPKPRSLYPPAILGLAMVARGEVAFLIASVANSKGIFSSGGEIYLVVIWAAMVCTVLGPLGVGMLVRRVKVLEKRRRDSGSGHSDVLGVWGVEATG